MTETNNTETTFYQQLQSLYSVESMLVEALPKMVAKASHLGLRKNLALHLAETDQHRVAIGAICKALGIDPQGDENADLKSILEEGEKSMAGMAMGDALDAVIIEGAQKVEAYEISVYGPAADAAEALGYEGFAKRLRLTLEEERQAKTKLKFMEDHLINAAMTVSIV